MITYVKGDATRPAGEGPKVIVHVCNDVGGWGAGFVVAVSRRWSLPEQTYRAQAVAGLELGTVQTVQVEPELWVANMIAQAGYGKTRVRHRNDPGYQEDFAPPVRYWAVEKCLEKVAEFCVAAGASVHAPRFGCGLAGGSWSEIEPIIERTLTTKGVPVTVYDLP